MTFGKAIKEQRIKKGLTQAQLAEMLGKAESTVRTWELDRSSPDRKALYVMCEIFGLTPDYFFLQHYAAGRHGRQLKTFL